MRISLDEMYMKMAETAAERSTCLKRSVGAVIAKEGRLISIGYNGAPRRIKNCCDVGKCLREKSKSGEDLQKCFAVHAEENAIFNAAYNGISTKDSTLYTVYSPCSLCAKAIINSGIINVFYKEFYTDELGMLLLKEAGIKLIQIQKENQNEERQK